jgi:hypothetical protein
LGEAVKIYAMERQEDVILNTPTEGLLEILNANPDVRPWLDKFYRFISIYGNRVMAAHLDAATPTWREDPSLVLDTIKGYYTRGKIPDGAFLYSKNEVKEERKKAIKDFESKLKDEGEATAFRRLVKAAQGESDSISAVPRQCNLRSKWLFV